MLKRMGKEKAPPGARAIIVLEVWKVTTSCGTGVPIIGTLQTREEELSVRTGSFNARLGSALTSPCVE